METHPSHPSVVDGALTASTITPYDSADTDVAIPPSAIDEQQAFQGHPILLPELLDLIFHHLSTASLKRVSQCSRLLYTISKGVLQQRKSTLLHCVLVMNDRWTSNDRKGGWNFTGGLHEAIDEALNGCAKSANVQGRAVRRAFEEAKHEVASHSGNPIPPNNSSVYRLIPVILHNADNILIESSSLLHKFTPLETNCHGHIFTSPFINDTSLLAIAFLNVSKYTESHQSLRATIRYIHTPLPPGSPQPTWHGNRREELYWGGLRDGFFGDDFVALFGVESVLPVRNSNGRHVVVVRTTYAEVAAGAAAVAAAAEGVGGAVEGGVAATMGAAAAGDMGLDEMDWAEPVANELPPLQPPQQQQQPQTRSEPRLQGLRFDALYIHSSWLSKYPRAEFNGNSLKGPIYAQRKWNNLYRSCMKRGLNIGGHGVGSKPTYFLRKHLFFEDKEGYFLIQALRLIAFTWVDKLNYFLDHDFKNKIKQNEIISKMSFEIPVREALMYKIRSQACNKLFEIPLGLEYLRVTGFDGDSSQIDQVFDHVSSLDQSDIRSRVYSERFISVFDAETLGAIIMGNEDCSMIGYSGSGETVRSNFRSQIWPGQGSHTRAALGGKPMAKRPISTVVYQ
ncbi:hypothetical protein HDU97_007851 [Phlyctochytrium planicorne]|nr:hypothetical protein HDU97_007851 [Phlyctochytrium planicorne]